MATKQRRGRRGKPFGARLTAEGEAAARINEVANLFMDTGPLNLFPPTGNTKNNKPSTPRCSTPQQVTPTLSKEKTPTTVDNDSADSGDLCLICAGSIKYYALGACSHRTCHICLLRMRALYKKRDCALCKTELPEVIFTTDAKAPFSSFDLSKLEFKDPHLSIYCETFEQLDELLTHLKFNCPHPECSSVLNNWHDFKFHTRSSHGLILCELCCSNKKVFAHEHNLLTPKGLTVHMNRGSVGIGKGIHGSASKKDSSDDQDAVGDDDGFTGHPRCDFCATHFYDDDQLYQHCRKKHEQCFICVRSGVDRWRYYLDYKHLESHFRHDHYLCTQSACLEAGFMVYETALDLQAHQIEAHGAEMGMRAIKDARKLETNFNYSSGAEPPQPQSINRASREQRSGRSPMVMDITLVQADGASVLSNANRIVPGLGPNAERSGNRKPDKTESNRRPDKGKSKSTLTDARDDWPQQSSSSDLNDTGQSSSKPTSELELQRHAMLLKRVGEAVNGAEAKIASFKVAIRMYRNHEMAPSDLLDNLCSIFEHRSEIIGSILSNLLDLLDVEDERKEHLLEKWLDLKIGKSPFPSLDVNSSKRLTSLLESADLKSLSASTWVRQTPKYSKLLEGPKKNTQQVPGLSSKPRNVGVQRQTAWSSGATNQPGPARAPVKPRPATVTTRSTPSVIASSHSTTNTTHFPSLPTKSVRTTPKPGWKANIAVRDSNWNQSSSVGSITSSSGLTTTTTTSTTSTVGAAGGGGKKSKKIVLFTNSR